MSTICSNRSIKVRNSRIASAVLAISLLSTTAYTQPTADTNEKTVIENVIGKETKSCLLSQIFGQSLKDSDCTSPLKLKLAGFETSKDDDNGFGLEYEFEQTAAIPGIGKARVGVGENGKFRFVTNRAYLRAQSKGTIAFDGDENPKNFIEANLGAGLNLILGGRVTSSGDVCYLREVAKLPATHTQLAIDLGWEDEELVSCALVEGLDTTTVIAYVPGGGRQVNNFLGVGVHFDGVYETDQQFENEQHGYRLLVTADIEAFQDQFKNSWSDLGLMSQLNIFDYPTAFIRMLTGSVDCRYRPTSDSSDSCSGFLPRDIYWPDFAFGIASINPDGNDIRKAADPLDGEDNFMRLEFEADFEAPVFAYQDQKFFLGANYRYFKELNPSDAISSAGLDDFEYYTLLLSHSSGLYVSYANGQFPFDQKDQSVVSVGLKFPFAEKETAKGATSNDQ